MMNKDRVIVALDNMNRIEALHFATRADNTIPYIKVGLELFNRYGSELVRELANESGKKVFLDLKLHDIPNTVEKAILALEGLPIQFLTVHLSGGHEMLVRAKEALTKIAPSAILLGVSILTSLGAEDISEISNQKFDEAMNRLLNLAKRSQVAGLVSSAQELELIAQWEKANRFKFIKVCPGIRFSDESTDDQKRVVTPQDAFANGANFLVMGRSLTRSKDLKNRIEMIG